MTGFLVLDAAGPGALSAFVRDDAVVAARRTEAAHGAAAALPAMTAALLGEAGPTAALACIACVVGPGSFTGIRASLALAHGVGLALSIPVIGVTVGEALRALDGLPRDRAVWVAVAARRGKVFLDKGGPRSAPVGPSEAPLPELLDLAALPSPSGPLAVIGDAADEVAAALAARGCDVVRRDWRQATPLGIARAAASRLRGELPLLPALPLYVEPPMARAAAQRPSPEPVHRASERDSWAQGR